MTRILEVEQQTNNQLSEQIEVLKKENQIMGKILIDIVLHNNGFSDERINELLNQED